MVIRAIFFDFDGTISNVHKIAYDSLINVLDSYNCKFDRKKAYILLGDKMSVILKRLGLEIKYIGKVRKSFYKHLVKTAKEKGVKPCVSLSPLWELRKIYPLIVVSNSETRFLKVSVEKLKIKNLFKKIYGADKFDTKDKVLIKLFKKMKIKPHEAIYIGDRFSDVRYAKKAGCFSVAINNKCSWSDLKTVKKEKPDFIIKDFRGIKKVIQEIEAN